MEALRNADGFLGTGASLLVDITLVVQILFYFTLCVGVVVQLSANRGKTHLYKWHDRLQAPVVGLNLLFIFLVMIPTFRAVWGGSSGDLGNSTTWVPVGHGILGSLAEGISIYCLLAGFKILPRKIGVLRYWMWTAFTLWTITILFGIGIYLVYYTGGSGSDGITGEHDADMIAEHDQAMAEQPAEATDELVEEHTAEVVDELVTEGTEEAVEEHEEEPVEESTTAPDPTDEPPTATEESPAASETERSGIVRMTDGNVHNDKVTVQLSGITPPTEGFVYEGWLQSDSTPPFSLGVLEVVDSTIKHEFIDPAGGNLLNVYGGAFISLEPSNDSDPAPSGVVVYSGEVAPAVMAHVRHVVTAFPNTPDGDGFAFNALAEAGLILQQVEVQQQSIINGDLVNLHIHGETTLNIIEGVNSPNYGDRDGDGETFNPGDGFGLLRFGDEDGYLASAGEHATLASESEGASAEVVLHAEHVNIGTVNAIAWAEHIAELEDQILQVENTDDAVNLVAEVVELTNALLEGVDVNGDGQIDPVPGEGGIRTMYEHGQYMGTIELFATEGVEAAPPPEPNTELVEEHAEDAVQQETAPEPTATPQPEATSTPEPEASSTPEPEPTPTVELISEHDGG